MKKILLVISIAIISSCAAKFHLNEIKPSTNAIDTKTPEDAEIAALIAPYQSKLNGEMNAVLIQSDDEAIKGQPEGKLGNLIADITLAQTNVVLKAQNKPLADICMLNNGGLRTSLPKGDITMGKIFELMPFENEIAILTLSGEKTEGLFNYIAIAKGMPLAGARLVIKDEKPTQITINGQPFDKTKTYRVATSDYLAGGGDKMRFFAAPLAYEMANKKLRDAIADYMEEENKKGNTLKPKLDGRITNE